MVRPFSTQFKVVSQGPQVIQYCPSRLVGVIFLRYIMYAILEHGLLSFMSGFYPFCQSYFCWSLKMATRDCLRCSQRGCMLCCVLLLHMSGSDYP